MITYEVRVSVPAALADEFERYMREKHIPEILATGCFAEISFERAASGDFRTRYLAASQEGVDRYLSDHAAHFRGDFALHFGEKATAVREMWDMRQVWKV